MSVLQNIRFLGVFNRFMKQVSDNPRDWLPSALALATAAVTIFTPQLQLFMREFFQVHPVLASSIGGLVAVILHVLPSPITQPTEK